MEMKLSLLIQASGDTVVTMAPTGTPIIRVDETNYVSETIMAINFLRAGAGKVQLCMDPCSESNHWRNGNAKRSIGSFLQRAQLDDELFILVGELKPDDHDIVEITRTER